MKRYDVVTLDVDGKEVRRESNLRRRRAERIAADLNGSALRSTLAVVGRAYGITKPPWTAVVCDHQIGGPT